MIFQLSRPSSMSGDAPHPGKVLDMVMLQQTGGEERSEAEYGALLDKAGFHLRRVIPTNSAVSVAEAIAA
jgi:O-methyltransferase domain